MSGVVLVRVQRFGEGDPCAARAGQYDARGDRDKCSTATGTGIDARPRLYARLQPACRTGRCNRPTTTPITASTTSCPSPCGRPSRGRTPGSRTPIRRLCPGYASHVDADAGEQHASPRTASSRVMMTLGRAIVKPPLVIGWTSANGSSGSSSGTAAHFRCHVVGRRCADDEAHRSDRHSCVC